jgi:hypothetical protein
VKFTVGIGVILSPFEHFIPVVQYIFTEVDVFRLNTFYNGTHETALEIFAQLIEIPQCFRLEQHAEGEDIENSIEIHLANVKSVAVPHFYDTERLEGSYSFPYGAATYPEFVRDFRLNRQCITGTEALSDDVVLYVALYELENGRSS